MQWPTSHLVQNRNEMQKPEILKKFKNTTLAEGSNLFLEMETVLNGGHIKFFKKGIELKSNDKIQITNSGLKWRIEIEQVTQFDHGAFMAQISNSYGTVETRCIVNIVKSTPISIKPNAHPPAFDEIMEDCQIAIG